jgi:hypothetical protein
MTDNPTEQRELAQIAGSLEEAGADVARLRAREGGDAFATTSAYAALLAARAEIRGCLEGLPTPPRETPDDADAARLVNQLSDLLDELGQHARTHDGPESLACARAALYVEDARSHLAAATI